MTVKIENKETPIMLSETEKVKYVDLLMTAVNKPVPEGCTIAEMRRDLRIFDILEKGKDESELEFTPEDVKYLVKKVEDSVWAVRHPSIVEFADYIATL